MSPDIDFDVTTGATAPAADGPPAESADARLREIREHMSRIPEGRRLLEFADRNGIRIELDSSLPPHTYGDFAPYRDGRQVVRLNVSATAVDQAFYAFHELRHAEQYHATGSNYAAWHARFFDPGSELLRSRILETDAHVYQVAAAAQLRDAGHPEMYDRMRVMAEQGNTGVRAAVEFLDRHPPSSFPDESAMHRALFDTIYRQGLPHYNTIYFQDTVDTLGRLTPEQFQASVDRGRQAPPLLTDGNLARLSEIGGRSYLDGATMEGLRGDMQATMTTAERALLQEAGRFSQSRTTPAVDDFFQQRVQFRESVQRVYNGDGPGPSHFVAPDIDITQPPVPDAATAPRPQTQASQYIAQPVAETAPVPPQPAPQSAMPQLSERLAGMERVMERTPDGGHVMHIRQPNATMIDLKRTMDELRAMGLKPEAVDDPRHGMSVRLQGDDAVRMHVFAGEQARQGHIPMPQPSDRLMGMQRVIERTPDGGHAMHIRQPNASMIDLKRTMDELRAMGLKPEAVNDPRHGMSVRLQGDDAVRMMVFANEHAAQAPRAGGGKPTTATPTTATSTSTSTTTAARVTAPVVTTTATGPAATTTTTTAHPQQQQGSRFTGATASRANGHISRTQGVADVAVNVAAGNYGQAATSAGMQVALTPGTYTAAARLTQSVSTVASGLAQVARRAPVIGAVVTAGFVAYEVGSYLANGEYGRAGAATLAGGAEMLGNTVGFGAGDAAREAVRAGVIATAGEQYTVNRSGIGNIVATAVEITGRGDPDKIAAQQKALIEKDPVLPKTVTLNGKTVPLVDALRDATFRKTFIENLEKTDRKGEIDLKAQIAKVREFGTLEDARQTAISARNADNAAARQDISTPVPGMMPLGA